MVKIPSVKTLAKYGLDDLDFIRMVLSQGSVCAICKKPPKNGQFRIDHEHLKNWKKLSDIIRRSTVRGGLCWNCNYRFLAKGMTLDKARNLVQYLERYEKGKERHD